MAEPFKNIYNDSFINTLGKAIVAFDKSFDEKSFKNAVLSKLESLELKQRIRLISTHIDNLWPATYAKKIDILVRVKQNLSKDKDFMLAATVFPDFVEVYGLNDYETSIKALKAFTIDSTSEFAIRPFIIKYEDRLMHELKVWAQSDNEHIRRLCSEGCRPRLPWGIALNSFKKDPRKVFEVLELLKNDESLYVRKSVANNLNDISKDNPQCVIEFIKKNIGLSSNLDWILKHGARTLLKASNSEVLELFGYANTNIQLDKLKVQKEIKIGDDLPFSFEINCKENLGKIRIEYVLEMVRKNNKKSKKNFQISAGNYQQKLKQVSTKHSFKKVTTRNYYVGLHKVYILVNGKELASFEFDLIEE